MSGNAMQLNPLVRPYVSFVSRRSDSSSLLYLASLSPNPPSGLFFTPDLSTEQDESVDGNDLSILASSSVTPTPATMRHGHGPGALPSDVMDALDVSGDESICGTVGSSGGSSRPLPRSSVMEGTFSDELNDLLEQDILYHQQKHHQPQLLQHQQQLLQQQHIPFGTRQNLALPSTPSAYAHRHHLYPNHMNLNSLLLETTATPSGVRSIGTSGRPSMAKMGLDGNDVNIKAAFFSKTADNYRSSCAGLTKTHGPHAAPLTTNSQPSSQPSGQSYTPMASNANAFSTIQPPSLPPSPRSRFGHHASSSSLSSLVSNLSLSSLSSAASSSYSVPGSSENNSTNTSPRLNPRFSMKPSAHSTHAPPHPVGRPSPFPAATTRADGWGQTNTNRFLFGSLDPDTSAPIVREVPPHPQAGTASASASATASATAATMSGTRVDQVPVASLNEASEADPGLSRLNASQSTSPEGGQVAGNGPYYYPETQPLWTDHGYVPENAGFAPPYPPYPFSATQGPGNMYYPHPSMGPGYQAEAHHYGNMPPWPPMGAYPGEAEASGHPGQGGGGGGGPSKPLSAINVAASPFYPSSMFGGGPPHSAVDPMVYLPPSMQGLTLDTPSSHGPSTERDVHAEGVNNSRAGGPPGRENPSPASQSASVQGRNGLAPTVAMTGPAAAAAAAATTATTTAAATATATSTSTAPTSVPMSANGSASVCISPIMGPNGQPLANLTVEELVGKVYQICKDQNGCRFLQRKLEEGDGEMTRLIWEESCPHIVELMTDPFGNYLCQRLLEFCDDAQREALMQNASRCMARIALNQHGTRALQKMIECVATPAQVAILVESLRDSVVELIQDLNGNHVIQKCLQKFTPLDSQFIFDSVGQHCNEVGMHRHGCCVIQRCIDHANPEQQTQLVGRIVENALALVQDPYGNYVVQYIIDLNREAYTAAVVRQLGGHMGPLSRQKFSSNVVEKMIRSADATSRNRIVDELLRPGELERCLKDGYANYVVQTALTTVAAAQPEKREQLIQAIRPILPSFRTTPQGRRINSIMSQLEARVDDATPTASGGSGNARGSVRTPSHGHGRKASVM